MPVASGDVDAEGVNGSAFVVVNPDGLLDAILSYMLLVGSS